jgi:hypothetical protein
MNKRGQAAVEFLMTYGWAILVAIIAIGVLAYFGVFSPGKFMVGGSLVNPPFYLNTYNIGINGIFIELNNNGGEDFIIQNFTISNCGVNDTLVTIPSGGQTIIFVPCTLSLGNAFKGDILIDYSKIGSNLPSQSTGTIADKVI